MGFFSINFVLTIILYLHYIYTTNKDKWWVKNEMHFIPEKYQSPIFTSKNVFCEHNGNKPHFLMFWKSRFKTSTRKGQNGHFFGHFWRIRQVFTQKTTQITHYIFIPFNTIHSFLNGIFLAEKCPNIMIQWFETWRFGISRFHVLKRIFLAEKSFDRIIS